MSWACSYLDYFQIDSNYFKDFIVLPFQRDAFFCIFARCFGKF